MDYELPPLPDVPPAELSPAVRTYLAAMTFYIQALTRAHYRLLLEQTALTAEDSTVIDDTYGTDEEGVLNNVRIRVGEIEVILQGLDLLP